MSTVYTLKLPKGITALDGGETEEEVIWQLATDASRVIESTPVEGDDVFSVEGEIVLKFNQKMDLDFIRPGDNVLLFPSNDVDADKNLRTDGFFNTEVVYGKDEDKKTDKSILIFKPEFPYQFNQDYQLVIKAGLLGAASKLEGYGDREMKEDFVLNFKTISRPGIKDFKPINGEQSYDRSFVEIDFASPMTKELILEYAVLDPEPEKEPNIYLSNSNRHAEIVYNFEPSSYYNFTFKAPFKDEAENISEKGFKTSFKTAPRKPYLGLLTQSRFGVFTEDLGPTLPVIYVNLNKIDIKFCEISEQEFFNVSHSYNWYNYRCNNPVRKTINIETKLNQTHFLDLDFKEIFNRDFDQGIYFFEVSSRQYTDHKGMPYRSYQIFSISDTALTLKKSGQDILVWAVDLKTGKPVSRMELSIRSSKGNELQRGVTDGSGIFKITKDIEDNIYVIGTKNLEGESRWSLVGQYWNNGIQNWQFNIGGQWVDYGEPRIYLYTDRPLYRPGDELFFKGLYRVDQDADLILPKDKKVRLVLEDSEYNEVQTEEVFLLPDGSFNGTFNLSDKARLGRYNLYAETVAQEFPQRFYHHFFVEEYKKPKFKVELLSPKTDYQLSETIPVDIQANYYFGGAIQEGKVSWTLMREPYIFNRFRGEDYYSFGVFRHFHCFWFECRSETNIVAEGEGMLDQNGRLHLDLPTDQESEEGQSYLYTLNAEVENKDGEFVSNRETFIVHQGSYYIGLSVRNYLIKPKEEVQLKVITVSPEAEIVSGKHITLEIYKEEWNTVKKQGVDGAFYDESVRELTFVKKKTITTSSEPVEVSFEIKENMAGGRYVIQGKSQEGKNTILSETNFYVSSSTWVNWGSFNNNRMELTPDKPEYFVGGKARVLIKSPYGSLDHPAKALVTYERGMIQHYEVIDIKSNTDFIEIPIKENMVPNIYVTVLVMKEPGRSFDQFLIFQDQERLKSRQANLNSNIKTLEEEIDELKSDEDEKMKYRNEILISKKESELKNLKSELEEVEEALSTINNKEAEPINFNLIKPDFKFGIANLIVNKREHEIFIDLETSQPSYQVGDTVEIEIHTLDYQERPIPSVVSLAVVDESLLALKANRKISPLEYFYGNRYLQVNTANNLTLHVDRVNVAAEKGAKGGDGGLVEGFEKKRGEFKDTAYFNPLIETDEGGYAKVEFEPPDNLTTWEMWAVASSDDDKFGMVKEDFIVKKPIAITSILPRFVISEDNLTVGALLHNQSGKDVETKVELIADGLKIKGQNKKSVLVPNGGTERVNWEVEVKPVQKDSVLMVVYKSPQDIVQYSLPVKTFAFPEVVATNGIIETLHTEKVLIPDTVAQGMGGLDVRVGGSLATKFIKSFDDLLKYPYGCAEQLISKILPLLMVQIESMQNEDVDLFALMNLDAEKSMEIIEDVLQKLSKFQRFDGGYGFWEGSQKSNPILTSYILYAQYLGEKAGFTISENSFNLAIQFLWKQLNIIDERLKLRPNERAFVLWVLSEVGQLDTGMTLSLFEKREELSLYSHALMLMNMQNLYNAGQRSVRPFIERLKSEIVSTQIVDERTIHFEEEEIMWWDMNTNRRTTAMVLMALNRDNPDNPILPQIVNYLVSSMTRSNMPLINTQETAWMLMAMLEYAKSQDVLIADFEFDVEVNNDTLLEGTINAENLSEIFEANLSLDDLIVGDDMNEVNFEKDGEGQMVFDMVFKYFLPNEVILPLEKGLHITRNYYTFDEKNQLVKTMQSGELYRGELNIIVPEDMYYVVVEERLPAGVEAINFNLETVDKSLEYKLEQITKPEGERYWIDNPLWRFNHREMRDDRVLLFADYLPKGVYTYSFLIRTGLPGNYHHLPASAYQMYFPEVFGRTGGEILEIRD